MKNKDSNDMTIDADFPGGNIIVEAVESDRVRLRQDWSTSSEWWFYWYFRVKGAAGRRVWFTFGDGDVFSAGGACVSEDGDNWRWPGPSAPSAVDSAFEYSFEYTFAPEEGEVYFAFCPFYTERHLAQFLGRESRVQREALCRIENDRELEHLWLESKHGRYVVPFLARTHACEMMANYVLEGLFEYWLHDGEGGAWLREWVDLRAVPFMDKSGVENGEQGKFRIPHDHNRDWTEQPRYSATRAVMQAAPTWRGEMPLFLDLHCP
jgi:murein tripeptide amidase MpaA